MALASPRDYPDGTPDPSSPAAPLFHEKLIGFRGWGYVPPPLLATASSDPEVLRLAKDLEQAWAHGETLKERIAELHEQLHAKDSAIASLVMQSQGHVVAQPRAGRHGVALPPIDPMASAGMFHAAGTAGYFYAAPPPPLPEEMLPARSPDPGLWTGDHTYWHPGKPARAVCRGCHYSSYVPPSMRLTTAAIPGHHPAPDEGCTCGLHATYEWGDAAGYGSVVGAVTAWGRIIAHKQVFRAEYMQPVLLACDPAAAPTLLSNLERLAKLYGVELVTVFELAERAREFGKPIPEEFRGRPKPPPMDPRIPLEDMRAVSSAGKSP